MIEPAAIVEIDAHLHRIEQAVMERLARIEAALAADPVPELLSMKETSKLVNLSRTAINMRGRR